MVGLNKVFVACGYVLVRGFGPVASHTTEGSLLASSVSSFGYPLSQQRRLSPFSFKLSSFRASTLRPYAMRAILCVSPRVSSFPISPYRRFNLHSSLSRTVFSMGFRHFLLFVPLLLVFELDTHERFFLVFIFKLVSYARKGSNQFM